MSNLGMRHPTDEQLLHFADGELPAPQTEKIRSHLQACWHCRSELEEIERTIGQCVRYRKIVLETRLPPPAQWFDIYPRLASIDETERRRNLLRRAIDSLAAVWSKPRRWVPAAAMLLLIVFVVQQFRQVPSVKAAELLHKAIAAAEARPRIQRRIQIRTRTGRLARVVGSSGTLANTSDATGSLAGLESLFRAAHYSWEDPLSAKSYSEWRNQLPDKRDEVTLEADRYGLRTTTDSGELVEATLKLSIGDLRPVEETLQFRNHEWVEISELPYPAAWDLRKEVSEAAPTPAAHPAERDRAREVPAPAPTPGEELQVLAALHWLGADLGDPVEVTRSGGQILVRGTGIAPERQQEIRDELRAMPRVTFELSSGPFAEASGPDGLSPRRISVGAGTGRLQTEMQQQLGGRATFEEFADQVLEMTDAMMSRAYALRRLAERFSPDLEAQMTAQQRQVLESLRREHAEVLLRNVTDIQERTQPVLTAMGAPAGALQDAGTPGLWQDDTEQLFSEARHAETLLVGLMGASAGETQPPELPTQVLTSLARLRQRAENYGHPGTGR